MKLTTYFDLKHTVITSKKINLRSGFLIYNDKSINLSLHIINKISVQFPIAF